MLHGIGGIAIGPSGQIADVRYYHHHVHILHPNGTFDFEFGSWGRGDGEFHGPFGVDVAPDGMIAVADMYNHRVQLFHPNGTFALVLGSQDVRGTFPGALDVAIGHDGLVAVTGMKSNRIHVFQIAPPGGDSPPPLPRYSADIAIDASAPSIAGVSASIRSATLAAGDSAHIHVVFDEPVRVITALGLPALSLAVGGHDAGSEFGNGGGNASGGGGRAAPYSGGNGTDTLSFLYTARTGDYSDDLSYAGTDALLSNGARVVDAAGNAANLTLPTPGENGSLSHWADIAVRAHPRVTEQPPPQERQEPPQERQEPPQERQEPPQERQEPPQERQEPPQERHDNSTGGGGTAFTGRDPAPGAPVHLSTDAVGAPVPGSLTLRMAAAGSATDGIGGFDELDGAVAADTFAMGGTAYALVASHYDDGVQLVRIHANGTLEAADSVTDGERGFDGLAGPHGVASLGMGPSMYALVASHYDDGVQLVRIHANGTLEAADSVTDGERGFDGLDGALDVAALAMGGRAYAVAASLGDNAVQLIRVHANGTLEAADSARGGERGFDGLAGPHGIDAFGMGNATYAITASLGDSAVQLIRVHANGTLEAAGSARGGDRGFEGLGTLQGIDAFGMGNATYAVTASYSGAVQLIRVHANGTLEAAGSVADGARGLGGFHGIDAFTLGGSGYALAASRPGDGVQLIRVRANGTLEAADFAADGDRGFEELGGAVSATAFSMGGAAHALATSVGDDGLQLIRMEPAIPALGVTTASGDGSYGAGSTIDIDVGFGGPVLAKAPLGLRLNSGGTAAYHAGGGTDTLTFRYVVQPGEHADDLDYAGAGAVSGGGTITDAATGASAGVVLPPPGSEGSLGGPRSIAVDTRPPAAVSVTSAAGSGAHGAGSRIAVAVNFDEAVFCRCDARDAGDLPTLGLLTGGPNGTAVYSSGSGTRALVFSYEVRPGDHAADLGYAGASALAGILHDGAGNPANLALPQPGAPGSLSAGHDIAVDGVPPRALAAGPASPPGLYGRGGVVNMSVSFTEPVTVYGSGGGGGGGPLLPYVELGSGMRAAYASGNGTSELAFSYAVRAGDRADRLAYAGTSALVLNGSSVEDAAGNAADLALPPPPGGANASARPGGGIRIDADPPEVAGVSASNLSATLLAGDAVHVSVRFDEAVTVLEESGRPSLLLEVGGGGGGTAPGRRLQKHQGRPLFGRQRHARNVVCVHGPCGRLFRRPVVRGNGRAPARRRRRARRGRKPRQPDAARARRARLALARRRHSGQGAPRNGRRPGAPDAAAAPARGRRPDAPDAAAARGGRPDAAAAARGGRPDAAAAARGGRPDAAAAAAAGRHFRVLDARSRRVQGRPSRRHGGAL